MDNNITSGQPSQQQLDKINLFTRKKMGIEDVYVFNITLCDNEVDRDNERFSIAALEELAKMFIGKTGIFDHSMKTRDQCARIFECEVVADNSVVTSVGETYHALKATAYIPRFTGFENIISEIDSGIKKEVSVSCTVNKRLCSICGQDQNTNPCGHMRGRYYKKANRKEKCYVLLDMPSDAYEWSFVAVPAQPKAGVTKSVSGEGHKNIKSMLDCLENAELKDYIHSLKQKAEAGELYAQKLRENAVKYSLLANPSLKEKTVNDIVGLMDIDSLIEFEEECKKAANEVLPLMPQLSVAKDKNTTLDKKYVI